MESGTEFVSMAQHEAALELVKCQQVIYEKKVHSSEAILEIRNLALAKANADLNRREIELITKIDEKSKKLLLAQHVGNVATFHFEEDYTFVCSGNIRKMLLIDEPIKDLRQLFECIHPLETDDAKQFLCGNIVSQHSGVRDVRFLAQDGTPRWLRWHLQKSPGESGSFHGAVRDVTQDRYLERRQRVTDTLRARQVVKLERLSVELKERSTLLAERVAELEALGSSLEDARNRAIRDDRAKSRFLAMMSHDIRTPMNAIMALLDLPPMPEPGKMRVKLLV